jgi:hypothetical protein
VATLDFNILLSGFSIIGAVIKNNGYDKTLGKSEFTGKYKPEFAGVSLVLAQGNTTTLQGYLIGGIIFHVNNGLEGGVVFSLAGVVCKFYRTHTGKLVCFIVGHQYDSIDLLIGVLSKTIYQLQLKVATEILKIQQGVGANLRLDGYHGIFKIGV